MDHEWIVEVQDDKGTAITAGATVALVPSSAVAGKDFPFTAVAATHAHKSGGVYEASKPIVPVVGDWVLIVRVAKKSPVVQPLKMRAKGKVEIQTVPSPNTVATIGFSAELKTIGRSQLRRSRFKVTLYPSSEIVCISGTEYFSAGTQFRKFAQNHTLALLREKRADDGVIMTLFSADDRSRDTLVPAAGGGLVRIAAKSFGPTAGITPGKKHDPVIGLDISPPDMYTYLSGVGSSEPGRVIEVGFFTHSYPGGPILFNKGDDPSVPDRLPTDFDARMKDFNPTNVAKWPKLKLAMSAGGSWHVWGCSATTHNKNLVAAALGHKKAGDDTHFTVNTTSKHHDGRLAEKVEERTTRKRVKRDMDARFRKLSYMAAATKFLGMPVFGPPPGVGSSFANPSKPKKGQPELNVMYIDIASNSSTYAYFKTEFGPEFEPTNTPFDKGYVDYRRLGTRGFPPAAPFSSEYYKFVQSFDTDPANEESKLIFADGRSVRRDTSHTKLKVSAKSGFATLGLGGHLYEIHVTTDESLSRALYVQDDGKIFKVNKDAAGKFTVLGALIP
jgi:hypothetical protein